ncbi:hypothetical protein [Mesorhizobium amorphae]|uniref:hypothetical protein n=1 Tax=Mesorhizobium amorphae TaxID=71433 RepID=UPI0024E04255|nr:hypothetical protein [Mesorhizobium amorphae]
MFPGESAETLGSWRIEIPLSVNDGAMAIIKAGRRDSGAPVEENVDGAPVSLVDQGVFSRELPGEAKAIERALRQAEESAQLLVRHEARSNQFQSHFLG